MPQPQRLVVTTSFSNSFLLFLYFAKNVYPIRIKRIRSNRVHWQFAEDNVKGDFFPVSKHGKRDGLPRREAGNHFF